MQNNNATRRYSMLIFVMYLTYTLGLSVVTATEYKETSTQVVAEPLKSSASTQHSTPKRDAIVSKNEPTIRDIAKVWFLKRMHHEEWLCIDEIIYRESRWTVNAQNPTSTAFGLGQVKNSRPYTFNKPMKQFIRAIKYAIYRYGTLCNALEAHNRQGWY